MYGVHTRFMPSSKCRQREAGTIHHNGMPVQLGVSQAAVSQSWGPAAQDRDIWRKLVTPAETKPISEQARGWNGLSLSTACLWTARRPGGAQHSVSQTRSESHHLVATIAVQGLFENGFAVQGRRGTIPYEPYPPAAVTLGRGASILR
jgi:hypothetical protein